MNGKLVILSGPSGVGKDTVIDRWKQMNPRVERVVAFTTREPRLGEIEGKDYHFVSRDSFEKMAKDHGFLEYKEVHGNYYGTPLFHMQHLLEQGKIAILKIDVQGAEDVFRLRSDAVSIFLHPPSMIDLENRIRARGKDNEDAIQRRVANAKAEIDRAFLYQHQIVNADLGDVVRELLRIVP